jgi:hypothetical protein
MINPSEATTGVVKRYSLISRHEAVQIPFFQFNVGIPLFFGPRPEFPLFFNY